MSVCVPCVKSASQYLTIIGQCLILLFGFVGNILIFLVFMSRKATLRKSPSSLYFASMAIVSILHIAHAVTWHVLSDGFGIDPTRTSLVYCKLRQYLLQGTLSKIVYTLECAAAISQFLATSRNAHYRQRSTHTAARWCIVISIFFWCLHGVPYLFLNTIKVVSPTNQTRCDAFNTALRHYTTWVGQNLFTFLLPGSVLAIFGYLTLRNVRRLGNSTTYFKSREQIERQVSFILLIQIISIFIGCIPLATMAIYTLVTETTQKSLERKAIESFIQTIGFVFINTSLANSFYLFYGTSASFRKQCKLVLPGIFGWSRRERKNDPSIPPTSTTVFQTIV